MKFEDENKEMVDTLKGLSKKVIAILGVIGVIVILFFMSFFKIESGTAGVISTFGKYDPVAVMPGAHFKIPFIQNVVVMDTKVRAVNYIGNKDLPDTKGVVNKPKIDVLDTKNLPIGIELTVTYTPRNTEVSNVLRVYGLNFFDKLINPTIRDVVRDVIGKYQAEKIAKERGTIAKDIKRLLEEKFAKTEFILNEVSLRDIKLPQNIRKKIEEVQLAKQEEQRLEMVEKQALKTQRIKKTQAETRKIEITTQAQANAERVKIEADAKAYKLMTEAKAKSKANKLIAESITKELIRYKSVERWEGSYPKVLMSGSNTNTLLQLPEIK